MCVFQGGKRDDDDDSSDEWVYILQSRVSVIFFKKSSSGNDFAVRERFVMCANDMCCYSNCYSMVCIIILTQEPVLEVCFDVENC